MFSLTATSAVLSKAHCYVLGGALTSQQALGSGETRIDPLLCKSNTHSKTAVVEKFLPDSADIYLYIFLFVFLPPG